MSTDFSIRPVGAPAPTPVVAPQSQAASDGVATQLPASQTVTAPDAGAAKQSAPQEDVTHQAFFDRQAASMVFQVVNSSTEQVVDQYPDEAVLRRRAYFHAIDLAKSSEPRVIPTDRTA